MGYANNSSASFISRYLLRDVIQDVSSIASLRFNRVFFFLDDNMIKEETAIMNLYDHDVWS